MFEVCLAASFGAFLQELLHWAEQRNRLKATEFQALVKNYGYWIIVALLIPSTGIAAYFWFSTRSSLPLLHDALIFGAALPALFKKGAAAATSRRMGGSQDRAQSKSLRELYLGV